MPHIGGPELIIILLIVLLLFGGSKLPQLARGLGDGLREFKKASKENAQLASDTEREEKEERERSTTASV